MVSMTTNRDEITVVGAGLGGLVTAVAAREAGFRVRVLEAKATAGGRGETLDGPYRANWGPHVIYANSALWRWLEERGLGEPAARAARAPLRYRVDGRARRLPPLRSVVAALRLRGRRPPADVSFRDWVTAEAGAEVAAQLSGWAGALTYHHDAGGLAAPFALGRLHQVTRLPPTPRYVVGGWGRLMERLEERARQLGVTIECGVRVDALPDPPFVLAMRLESAARLLDDDALAWPGSEVVTIDAAVTARRGDAYLIFDLDEGGLSVTYSYPDATLAPAGERLVQAQLGVRPGESRDDAFARAERLIESGLPGWTARATWQRRMRLADHTGAVDPPGTSWRDRPAIARGDGVYVVSDKSRAPGLLGEVAFNAALTAVDELVAARERAPSVSRG